MRAEYATPGDWAEHAACVGRADEMDIPTTHRTSKRPSPEAQRAISRARSICLRCPVIRQCHEWAMTDPDPAYQLIAGGHTYVERIPMHRALGHHLAGRPPRMEHAS